MITKRNYKLTPETRSYGTMWKVEMWNDFGLKRTVYENNVMDASEVIYDWWERSEEEFDKMNSLGKAIKECIEIDKNNNIISGNYDGLD